MRRLVWLTMMLLAVLVVTSGCASHNYLAEAKACQVDCDAAWEAWNKHEDKLAARERYRAFVQACTDQEGIIYNGVCENKQRVIEMLRGMMQ